MPSESTSHPTIGEPPRVLVVVASRHGSTTEIARAIADGVGRSATGAATGVTGAVYPARSAPAPGRHDAVVLGSAVYAGRWLEEARSYAVTHAAALRSNRVWLFSSGPIGVPPFPQDEPNDVAALARSVGSRDHRVFPGRLDPAVLGFEERAMVTAMRAPVGDARDWPAVADWAAGIAATLTGAAALRT